MVIWTIVWALLASPVPLVFALSLLGIMASVPERLFYREYTGVLRLRPGGQVSMGHTQEEKNAARIRHTVMRFSPLMVRLTLSNRYSVRIWRDSCSEREYRRLLVVLKALEGGSSRDSSPLQ